MLNNIFCSFREAKSFRVKRFLIRVKIKKCMTIASILSGPHYYFVSTDFHVKRFRVKRCLLYYSFISNSIFLPFLRCFFFILGLFRAPNRLGRYVGGLAYNYGTRSKHGLLN